MNPLAENYLQYKSVKSSFEKEAELHAQRMINFLRECDPANYVDFDLHGEPRTTDTLDRFVLTTESDDFLRYETSVDEDGNFEYFLVPLNYPEIADEWEAGLRVKVKADHKLVRKEIKKIFGKRIKKSEYDLYAYPSSKGDTRFMRVFLAGTEVTPEDEVLRGIVTDYHPGFVYDRETALLYVDGWIREAKTVESLIETRPRFALERLFTY